MPLEVTILLIFISVIGVGVAIHAEYKYRKSPKKPLEVRKGDEIPDEVFIALALKVSIENPEVKEVWDRLLEAIKHKHNSPGLFLEMLGTLEDRPGWSGFNDLSIGTLDEEGDPNRVGLYYLLYGSKEVTCPKNELLAAFHSLELLMKNLQILVYRAGYGRKIEVLFKDQSVWLTVKQMAVLFNRDESAILAQIDNIFETGESKEPLGKIEQFNLDIITSVGARVNATKNSQFNRWATKHLEEYLSKGFTSDTSSRVKGLIARIFDFYHETHLTKAQVKWVKKRIKERYARTRQVNAPLFGLAGVPQFPSKRNVLVSALKQLTPEQLDFMMEEGRPSFSFQLKLLTPSDRLDLQRALLDGQPKKMDVYYRRQGNLFIWLPAEQHLAHKFTSKKIEWRWEFVQADQVLEQTQTGDDIALKLEDRVKKFKKNLPKGMRGTDRFTWATLMADGLERGKPLDGDSEEERFFTLVDEEGEFSLEEHRLLVCGGFAYDSREPHLTKCFANITNPDARFRISLDGPILP